MHISAIVHCSLSTSEIVLGCEGFHKEQMELSQLLSLAQKHGVNLIDLYSPNPDMQR